MFCFTRELLYILNVDVSAALSIRFVNPYWFSNVKLREYIGENDIIIFSSFISGRTNKTLHKHQMKNMPFIGYGAMAEFTYLMMFVRFRCTNPDLEDWGIWVSPWVFDNE